MEQNLYMTATDSSVNKNEKCALEKATEQNKKQP